MLVVVLLMTIQMSVCTRTGDTGYKLSDSENNIKYTFGEGTQKTTASKYCF